MVEMAWIWYNQGNKIAARDAQTSGGPLAVKELKRMRNPIQLPLPLLDATVEIELTKGQVTIIDAVDADLAKKKWRAHKGNAPGYYAGRTVRHPVQGKERTVLLHRLILSRKIGRKLESGEETDHINGDKLDNRRLNLRISNRSQNEINKGVSSRNRSGYKGVSWSKSSKKWQATIQKNKKQYFLGLFDTPEEAHEAYCEAAKELHGRFARFA